jgi:deoxyribodipyrimidine photolyase
MKTLVWFKNDLRVENNRLLDFLKEKTHAEAVVIEEPEPYSQIDDFITYNHKKEKFKHQSILHFVKRLSKAGIEVTHLKGNVKILIPELCASKGFTKIITSKSFDFEESKTNKALESLLAKDEIYIDYVYNNNWIPIDELPFPIKRTPDKFKDFMKEIKLLEMKYYNSNDDDFEDEFIQDLISNIEKNNDFELKKYLYSANNNFYQFLPDLTLGRISAPKLLNWLENRYKNNPVKNKVIKTFRQQLFMYEHVKLRYVADPELNFPVPFVFREPEIKVFQQWINGETKHPIINAIMKKLAVSSKISLSSKKLAIDYYIHVLELPVFWGYWYFKKQLMEYSNELNAFLWKQSSLELVDKRFVQTNISDTSLRLDPKNKFTEYWLAHQ